MRKPEVMEMLEDACGEKANDTNLLEGFNSNMPCDHTEYFDHANISECFEIQNTDIQEQSKLVNISEHEQVLDTSHCIGAGFSETDKENIVEGGIYVSPEDLDKNHYPIHFNEFTDLCTDGDNVLTHNRHALKKEAIEFELCERAVKGNAADNDECQSDDGTSTCDSHHDLHVYAYKSDTSINLESADNLAGQISHTESAFKVVTFCDCELPSSTLTPFITEHCSSPSEGRNQERNQVIEDLLEIRNDLKDLSCDIDDHDQLETRNSHKVKNHRSDIDDQDVVEIRNDQINLRCDIDLDCGINVVHDISEIRNDQEVKDFGCDIDDHNPLKTRNSHIVKTLSCGVEEQNLSEIRSDLKDVSCASEDDCFGLVWLFNNAVQETTQQIEPVTKSKSSRKRKKQKLKLAKLLGNHRVPRRPNFATSFKEIKESTKCFELDLDPSVTCSICLELFFKPTVCIPCNHVFCDPCLRRLTIKQSENVPCPLCRTEIFRCDLDKNFLERLMDEYPELLMYRAQQEKISKVHHLRLPFTPPVPLGRHLLRQIVASRNSQSNRDWMSHDWFKFLLGCTAGICLSLLGMVLCRVKSLHNARDVNIMFLSCLFGALVTFVIFKWFKI